MPRRTHSASSENQSPAPAEAGNAQSRQAWATPDLNTHLPITQQIVRQLRRQIEAGQYVQGDRLPGSRQLARQFNVSLNTVQAALGQLHVHGLIQSRPRRRAVVRGQSPQASSRQIHDGPILLVNEPGAIYPNFNNSWGIQVLHAAGNELAQRDLMMAQVYVPTVAQKVPAEDYRRTRDLLASASSVIWLASPGISPLILDVIERGLPVVTINAPPDIIAHNVVRADNIAGGRLIGRVFVELGYRRCLLLTRGIEKRRFAPELAQGFVDSFMKADWPLHGLDYRNLERGSLELGEQATARYLNEHDPPQGIFAVNDRLAIGAMKACQDRGLRIPEDVGIVSANGFQACREAVPTLSAWEQPVAEMGRQAAQMLLRLRRQPGDRLPPTVISSRLIIRQSLPHNPRLADIAGVEFDH